MAMAPPTPRSPTPAALYFAGIGTLLFGALGLCTQGGGVANGAFMGRLGTIEGASEEMAPFMEAQREIMFQATLSAGVGLLVVFILIGAGSILLARIAAARHVWIVFIIAIVAELGQTALAMHHQTRSLSAMESLIEADGTSGASMMGGFAGGAMAAGMGMIGCWAFFKVAFFAWAAYFVKSPEAQELFAAAPQYNARGDRR